MKLEKNSKKWFEAGDLPKCYFTFEIAKRLLAADAKGDASALQEEMEKIVLDLEQGMYLQEHQNKDGIPRMFVSAKEQYGSSEQAGAGGTSGDSDDDDIVVLDEEQVRQIRAENSDGSRPPLDTAALVVEMT